MLNTSAGCAAAADAATAAAVSAAAALLCLYIYHVISIAVPKVCLHDCLHHKRSETNCEADCDCSEFMACQSECLAGASLWQEYSHMVLLPGCNAWASN